MAKSFYEPKKIVRYSDNIIKNKVGLGAAPTPALRPSATKVTPKTEAIPPSAAAVSAPAPAPAPAPPVLNPTPPPPIPETRAFSFDGNTYLTASCDSTFGKKALAVGYLGVTFTPYWGIEETGSFALYSITNNDETEGLTVFIHRPTNSSGIAPGFEYISASILVGSKLQGTTLPNIYSGSHTELNFQCVYGYGTLSGAKVNGTQATKGRYVYNSNSGLNSYTGFQSDMSSLYSYLNNRTLQSGYTFAIGKATAATHVSSSQPTNFSGSMSNFYMIPGPGKYLAQPTTPSTYEDAQVKLAYQFEGNVSGYKGPDLRVEGTATFVSSSL